MKFNLNQFLISISFVLDYIEIDILDDITNHGKRVGYTALKMGEQFNMSSEDKFTLLALAIMHDIGGVENKARVSKTELEKAKSHCIIGENSVEKFPFFKGYENVILYHHENYDGSGYPYGLTEEQLDFPSQILVALDIYQALKEERPYRNSMKHGQAMDILNRMAAESKINLEVTRDIDIIFN